MKKLKMSELNRLSTEEFKEKKKFPVVVILDNIRSALNVGSVFRTGDAFLIEKIYLCGITAQPPNNEIHKTALGATDSVEWQYFENGTDVISLLKSLRYKIVAVEQVDKSVSLESFTPDFNEKYAFIFGNEVKGVEQNLIDECDFCIEIPQLGTKHSLNISVSAGIVLWEVFRKLTLDEHVQTVCFE